MAAKSSNPLIFTGVPERLAGLCSPPAGKEIFTVVFLPADDFTKTLEASGATTVGVFESTFIPSWRRRRLQTDAFNGIAVADSGSAGIVFPFLEVSRG
jgi:hypothetical protein